MRDHGSLILKRLDITCNVNTILLALLLIRFRGTRI